MPTVKYISFDPGTSLVTFDVDGKTVVRAISDNFYQEITKTLSVLEENLAEDGSKVVSKRDVVETVKVPQTFDEHVMALAAGIELEYTVPAAATEEDLVSGLSSGDVLIG